MSIIPVTKKTLKTTKSLKDPQVMPCCLNAQNLKFPKQPLSLSYGYPQMPCKKNSPVTFLIYVHWNTMFLGEKPIFAWLDQMFDGDFFPYSSQFTVKSVYTLQ